jgi:RNA polymerase sigma-70 factor, ECF subfamily
MSSLRSDITALLVASQNGDRQAFDRLVPLVYERLREIARARIRRERPDHTLDTAGLVHEAYLRLIELDRIEWRDRAHFFATASGVMRRVLVDYAQRRRAQKREGRRARVPLDPDVLPDRGWAIEDVLSLDQALSSLQAVNPRACRAIECRYFGGLSVEETAAGLGVSLATIKRDLRFGQAWLARVLMQNGDHEHAAGATAPDAVPRGGRSAARRAVRASEGSLPE